MELDGKSLREVADQAALPGRRPQIEDHTAEFVAQR